MKRRSFIKKTSAAGLALSYSPFLFSTGDQMNTLESKSNPFEISLSQWSFKDSIYGDSWDNYKLFKQTLHSEPNQVLRGTMDSRDIVVIARKLNVNAVDLVNTFWFGHRDDKPWLRDFRQLAKNEGVTFVCLMCGQLDFIGAKEKASRQKSIDQHSFWLEAAAELGCKQLRVNPYGEGTYLERLNQCAEGLHEMCERAEKMNIKLTVENHGHPGSNGAWLSMLVEKTAHKNLGVFLDFDNFYMGGFSVKPKRRYDRQQGILDLAEHTIGVSAKTRNFSPNGNEADIDYDWCVKTLLDRGFEGYMSAEYDGKALSDFEGSEKSIALLKRLQEDFRKN